MMHAFREAASKGDIKGASGKRLMQVKILKEMLAIDRPRAQVAMKSWAKFVESAAGREHHDFKSLDEYIPYRSFDVGQL